MIGLVSYIVFFLILSLIFGIAVLGLNLQWGFTGLFNAGVAGFIGIAENFFDLWRSADIGGSVLGGAYRYGGVMALIGILVGATDDY